MDIMTDTEAIKKCEHCGGNLAIANPSGYCNHVYYPENCKICEKRERADEPTDAKTIEKLKEFIKKELEAHNCNDFRDTKCMKCVRNDVLRDIERILKV